MNAGATVSVGDGGAMVGVVVANGAGTVGVSSSNELVVIVVSVTFLISSRVGHGSELARRAIAETPYSTVIAD